MLFPYFLLWTESSTSIFIFVSTPGLCLKLRVFFAFRLHSDSLQNLSVSLRLTPESLRPISGRFPMLLLCTPVHLRCPPLTRLPLRSSSPWICLSFFRPDSQAVAHPSELWCLQEPPNSDFRSGFGVSEFRSPAEFGLRTSGPDLGFFPSFSGSGYNTCHDSS